MEGPVQQANEFASQAEEYTRLGDYANASTAHFRAAELFLLAMSETSDSVAVKTLKLLYASHTRMGKELQRKLQNQIDNPAQNVTTERKAVHLYSNNPQNITASKLAEDFGSRNFFVGQGVTDSMQGENFTNDQITENQSQIGEQSYFILDGKDLKSNNPDDPFERFWDAVEGLVQKISSPLAFTTAPLGPNDPTNIPVATPSNDRESLQSDSSYMMVPSKAFGKAARKRNEILKVQQGDQNYIHDLEEENENLRKTVETLTTRVNELEKAREENHMLRSSIQEFTQNLQKQRAQVPTLSVSSSPIHRIQSSVQLPSRHRNIPDLSWSQHKSSSVSTANNEELYQQIRNLERELRKSNELNAAHTRRWEKLKESAAKKKRENRNSQESLFEEERDKASEVGTSTGPAASTMYYSATSNI